MLARSLVRRTRKKSQTEKNATARERERQRTPRRIEKMVLMFLSPTTTEIATAATECKAQSEMVVE